MKKTCATCKGYLAVPMWTYCQKCTPIRWKKAKEVDPYESVVFKCRKDKALMSTVLIYDEVTLEIIGYRKPRHMLC
jgi:hypothetical protein